MTASRIPDANRIRQSVAELRAGKERRTRTTQAGEEKHGIALALGGGFSRGFAHLGVLEVLELEQIPISSIVGTSIGGLLGAAYADGIPVRQLCELGRQVRIRDFIRFHRSANRAVEGSTGARAEHAPCDLIGQFVHEWFHARRVEELPIRTAIVTTDLDTGGTYVFSRGPLDVAIRAGCAYPGLFQPVEHEGRRLADGCMVAPVPTAVAARMKSSYVLGVAVGAHYKNGSLSGKASENHDLTPPWTTHADIILEPEVNQIGWTDFTRVDEARAAGAAAMRRALPQVRELLARRSRMRLHEESSTQPQNTAQSEFAI